MSVSDVSTGLSVANLIKKSLDVDEINGSNNNINNNNNNCKLAIASAMGSVNVHERFKSEPIRGEHEKFLRDCVDTILNVAVFDNLQRDKKVLEWHQPDELMKLFDMKLKATSDTDAELLTLINKTIRYSVKTGHPYFVNQLFSGVDPYALAGQWLTDALNPSVYTYEVSPVFVLMEEIVLREMRSIVGWANGDGDGLFSPGGSISNAYAISCARYKLMPDVKVMQTIS